MGHPFYVAVQTCTYMCAVSHVAEGNSHEESYSETPGIVLQVIICFFSELDFPKKKDPTVSNRPHLSTYIDDTVLRHSLRSAAPY